MGIINFVKKKIEDKQEENKIKDEIKKEAKKEALTELKPALKEKYKQEELDKLTGKKGASMFSKLAEEFKGAGSGSDEKLNRMLGKTSGNTSSKIGSMENFVNEDKINSMLGSKKKEDKEEKKGVTDDKIKRMLR